MGRRLALITCAASLAACSGSNPSGAITATSGGSGASNSSGSIAAATSKGSSGKAAAGGSSTASPTSSTGTPTGAASTQSSASAATGTLTTGSSATLTSTTVTGGVATVTTGGSSGSSTTGLGTFGATGSSASSLSGSTGSTGAAQSTSTTASSSSSSGSTVGSSSGSTAGSGSSGTTGSTGSCGPCPTGYTCGSANGTAVCRAPSGIPLFSHVFVILMENTSWSTLNGSSVSTTPYLHGLKTTAAYSTNYHGISHPSLPNYLALTSGSDQGVGCDCNAVGTTSCNSFTCSTITNFCDCPQTARSIAADLDSAGEAWRAYAESMGTPCNTNDSGNYAQRHVPFLYYSDVMGGPNNYCAEHVVDYSNLASDLATNPGRFIYIAPNLVDDMHNPDPTNNTNLPDGDTWLKNNVPNLTGSSAYTDNGLVVIVWDEDDGSGFPDADDPVPMYVLSPLAKTGYASSVMANHYSLLATIEDGLNLPRLANAASATPLADFFPAQ